MKKNLYELLEISPDANPEDIRAAMIRLGRIYATKGQTNESARAHFNQIKAAYKILSNPYRRANYDDTIKKKHDKVDGETLQSVSSWLIAQWQLLAAKKSAIFSEIQPTDSEAQITKQIKANLWRVNVWWQKLFGNKTAAHPPSEVLIEGERIIHQAKTHWLLYLDFGAILLVILSAYLLINEPLFFTQDWPAVSMRLPAFLSKKTLQVSVWHVGLITLFLIGLAILWEAFVAKQTTLLLLTSKRIIAKFGLLNQKIIELKLRRFESIIVGQSLLGLIFNYGTITITGMGGVKTTIPCVMTPLVFKQLLWQTLEQQVDIEN